VVAGDPERIIKYRFSAEVIGKRTTSAWWRSSYDTLLANRQFFAAGIESFAERFH
jgi:hypothetical protein